MSYKLGKPFSDIERADFIVQYNHNMLLKIHETQTALYALEPHEKLVDDVVVDNSIEYNKEKERIEKGRIAMLNLTGADVERAIYKAKGMDFNDIIAFLEAQPLSQDGTPVVDIKALKIELKANNFYRGNPYINLVGSLLGFSENQLDEFFETNDYTKLLTEAKE